MDLQPFTGATLMQNTIRSFGVRTLMMNIVWTISRTSQGVLYYATFGLNEWNKRKNKKKNNIFSDHFGE